MPAETDLNAISAWIDKNISAQVPPSPTDITYPLYSREKQINSLVLQHMIHNCRETTIYQKGCKNKKGECEKRFDRNVCSDCTVFTEKGFPVYKREIEQDKRVVPHNKDILLDWDGHANLEYAGNVHIIIYLYKYLYKGSKKETVQYRQNITKANEEVDEITAHIKARKICSSEVFWRLFGFETYPSPHPLVITIKVRKQSFLGFQEEKGQMCDLSRYFNRPKTEQFMNLTFSAFYRAYRSVDKKPANGDYITVTLQGNCKQTYIVKRQKDVFVRIEGVPINSGEIFFLRSILIVVPSYSLKDLLTFEGISYQTFQHSARARGLIENEQSSRDYFREIAIHSPPHHLRAQIVTMTINGYPTTWRFGILFRVPV